jgi:hypothetical protein
LIPADGFYEWKKVLGGKIPYSIPLKYGPPFELAGLWEGWKAPGSGALLVNGKWSSLAAQFCSATRGSRGRSKRPPDAFSDHPYRRNFVSSFSPLLEL